MNAILIAPTNFIHHSSAKTHRRLPVPRLKRKLRNRSNSFRLSFANSSWKCNRTVLGASPQGGEMFIARRSFLYSEAPQERNRFYLTWRRFRCQVSLLTERDHWP